LRFFRHIRHRTPAAVLLSTCRAEGEEPVPLFLVKKAAARCGLALVTLVLVPLAGLVFGLLLAVAFLFGKGGAESGSAVGGREELHDMIKHCRTKRWRKRGICCAGFSTGNGGVHCDTPRVQGRPFRQDGEVII
jgi:hypothetical protein